VPVKKPKSKGKSKVKSGNKGGRPTKYREEYAEQSYKLCLLGAIDAELANFFEVNEDTIATWKKRHKKFSEAVKSGKEKADAEVALSLFKRATGYRYEEATSEMQYDREKEANKLVVTKVVTKEVSPDTGACMAWLKNRQKTKWRDRQDLEISGKVVMFQGEEELED
jgi:iron-sulfur cluster repair protein YtfE (RIC family)